MTDQPAAERAELPDFRRMPVREALAWLAANGEPPDPRPDIDTDSLVRRFPHLAAVETQDLTVDGPNGPIPMRSYRDPTAAPSGRGLVWAHGGAFIGGHLEMPESNWVARELASRGIPVLAVDYVKCLAGVHFPAPLDDVHAAWRFGHENAERLLGVHPRDLVLGGASAGSTLASAVVTRMVEEHDPGRPPALLLVYPLLHPNGSAPSAELDPASPLDELALNYAGSVEALADHRVFAGLGDGRGFPPTFIALCENDRLRPSGEAFAATLERAGVPVTRYLEPGAEHGHIDHPGDPGALRTLDAITHWAVRPDRPTD
ncbi:alpha/beta hydrolase [Pseudolysinimonas yzui]|uniref:Esterase n=1 Tax=Pseudolysinimonas yzui TaxID=2708254 RepID=A0A8J3GQN3_9MICO|nr:alpha/beta hydrolase [Pseudolysinimonas yzui]GHF15849.1 esterase [Pseudolysinimonas yzui]